MAGAQTLALCSAAVNPPRVAQALLVGLALLSSACGEEETDPLPGVDAAAPDASDPADGGTLADAGAAPDAAVVDQSAPYFDPARLLEVEIELGADDWDELRRQTRSITDVLVGDQCLEAPFPSPFTYFSARVTVDGKTLEPVGVRKKGFIGSLSESRPSLKLSFDEFVPGQRLDGQERLTLNNARQDPSYLRTCLAYLVFERAGVPAPRCNFAHVTVNGQDLGVYVHVEDIKKPFLRRHFDDDEGLLYEGTLSDFREGWLGTFEKKTNREEPDDRAALAALASAAARPASERVEALEEVLDVDAFLSFWAAEVLLVHWDGYAGNTNNFFVYQDPLTARFYFLPWGADAVLSRGPFLPEGTPESVFATGVLAHGLYALPELRARYLDRLASLLSGAWREAELGRYVDEAVALIGPRVLEPGPFGSAVTALREAINTRRAELDPELRAGGLDWPAALRGSPCWSEVGTVRGELVTTWGTHPSSNPLATGTGTITVEYMDASFTGVTVGGSAGFGVSPDDRGQAVFILPALLADNAVVVLYVVTAPENVASGRSIPIDLGTTRAALLWAPRPGAELQIVGWVGNGQLEIEAGGLSPGAAIRVRVDASVLGQGGL